MRPAILAAALMLGGLAAPAAAQQAGRSDVQGAGANGAPYRGTATLQPIENGTWRIEWRVEGVVARGIGFVMPEARMLVVAYTMQDEIGVVAYTIGADGVLRGRYTQGQAGFIAAETLTPAGTLPRK